jgi:hypothetical protein
LYHAWLKLACWFWRKRFFFPYTAYSRYIEMQGIKHILSIYQKFNISEISNIFSFLRSSHLRYLYQVQTVKIAVPLLFLPV